MVGKREDSEMLIVTFSTLMVELGGGFGTQMHKIKSIY